MRIVTIFYFKNRLERMLGFDSGFFFRVLILLSLSPLLFILLCAATHDSLFVAQMRLSLSAHRQRAFAPERDGEMVTFQIMRCTSHIQMYEIYCRACVHGYIQRSALQR